jgi:hypothetical protein|tara:strand:+ start:44 stop:724 length:681 start_codon:yes stop_codon:yes gene_type:complete
MKVALCLHGYFDSRMDQTSKGSDGYNHIKSRILDKADVDVYIHSWQPELKDEIISLYRPRGFVFQYQKDFGPVVKRLGLENLPPDSSAGRSPFTVLSHFYSVQKCFEQVPFEDYDIVIKARFDLGRINRNYAGPGLMNPYPVQCINFDPELPMDKLHMANWEFFFDGPADMWFYGGPEVMKKFTTLYSDVEKHMDETNVNAVRLYRWWMEQNGLWDVKNPLDTEWE